jgi:hypothetical protein
MEKLKAELDKLINRLEQATDFRDQLEELVSVYPFNEYEYVISHLLAAQKLSIEEYHELRDSYIDRNLYLYVFEISAPRGFGERWAYGQLKQLVPELERPSKKLDSRYRGEYDFWLGWTDEDAREHGIRIEVKTSRAVDFEKPDQPLYLKALASDSARPFDMNFQQIKPACADVFVWLGVWRDKVRYWVLSSNEVLNNKYYSEGQHRGNVGEGQLHLNRDNTPEFASYEVQAVDIKNAIILAYKRQHNLNRRSDTTKHKQNRMTP